MKKTLAFLLAIVMVLGLCACGGGNAPADNTGESTTTTTEGTTTTTTSPTFVAEDDNVFNDAELNWG